MAFSMVQRVAVAVHAVTVEVLDLAQAVTAQGQGVGHVADVVLAGIEGVLLGLDRCGVTVRDHHFREGGPVDDRPFDALVTELELVQDQAFTRGEPDPEGPVGPPDVVTGDREGGPFGLGDVDRFQVRAGFPDVLGQVVTPGRGHRDGLVIFKPDNLTGREVIEDDEVLDRVRVRAVIGLVTNEHQRPHQPPALGVLTEIPHRPRLETHQVQVRQATLGQRRDHLGIFPARFLALSELVRHERRLNISGQLHPPLHRARFKINHSLERTPHSTINQDRVSLTSHPHTIAQILLGRLTQLNTDKTERLRRRRTLLQNSHNTGNLLPRQRIQRMRNTHKSLSFNIQSHDELL